MRDLSKKDYQNTAHFLFELGTLRKIVRAHRQTLLSDDLSDNIASHSYRVAMIGWLLAEMERVDASKVVMMCLLHDVAEARSGDQNWVHKRYVKVFEEEIKDDQFSSLPFGELREILDEYDARESEEALVAKDADLLDQVLLLKEYAWQGNKEAEVWLSGKSERSNAQLAALTTESGKKLGRQIYESDPSEWWNDTWTNKNR